MRLTPTIRITRSLGDETVVLTFRHPTPQEQSDYLRSEYVPGGAHQILNRVPEARLALADKLLLDVTGLNFAGADGADRAVGAALELTEADRAEWSKNLGIEVRDWKDLVPGAWKISAVTELQINGWASPDQKTATPEAAPAVP